MIVDIPGTTTSKISKKIMALREQGGVIALGRVLTLVVVTKSGLEEEAIEAAPRLRRACRGKRIPRRGTPAAGRSVLLCRDTGDIQLSRPGRSVAELPQPGQPAQRISVPRRTL